jgi:alpha-beta hydrolase superfamily lysophospholipase
MSRPVRIALISFCSLLVVWFSLGAVGAYIFSMPLNRDFEDVATLGEHTVEPVSFEATDGKPVSGWYVAQESDKAVIFTHGIGGDRRHNNRNAEFFLERGYATLLIDLRSHGKSAPVSTSVGYFERHDLMGALNFLKAKGYKHIGASGVSLGAATIAFSFMEKPELSFVVLESSYDTIDHALNNRVQMVGAPVWVVYPFRLFSPMFVGAGPDQIRPLDWMDEITVPTLILAGDSEKELKVEETQSLYDACGAKVKEIHFFKGARHNTHKLGKYPEEYTSVMDEFLTKVFPTRPAPADSLASSNEGNAVTQEAGALSAL